MGGGYVSLGVDRGPLDKGLEAAKASFQTWGKGIAALGAAIASAGVAVAAPFLSGLSDFISWGSEMRNTMRMVNMSFDDTDLAMDGMRLSAEELPVVMRTMDSFMVDAATSSGNTAQALRDMGLSFAELNAMTRIDRLLAFAGGLDSIGDAALRSDRIRSVFGGRGGLTANIEGGAAGIRARAARADELEGASGGRQAFLAATALGRAKSEMNTAINSVSMALAFAAAPVMQSFYELVTKIAIGVQRWADANRPLLTTIFYIADKVILAGMAIGFLGGAVYAASYAFSFIQGAIAVVGGVFSWLAGIVVGVLSAALWVLMTTIAFVKGGFGLLTLASFLWGIATSIWTGIVFVATLLYGVALMAIVPVFFLLKAVSFMYWLGTMIWMGLVIAVTFLYKGAMLALSFAYGVYAMMTGVAVVATNGFTLSLIAAWIWENLVSLGINLIITAIVALIMVIIGFVVLMAVATVAAGALIISFFSIERSGQRLGSMFRSLVSSVSAMASSIGQAFSAALSNIMNYISQFFTSFMESASVAFEHVVGIGTQAFGAIRDAFQAGEWEMIWNIVVVAAQLAWIRMYPAVMSFTDGMVDLFGSAWNIIKSLFIRVWGEIKAIAFEGIAAILTATLAITPAGPLTTLITAQAAGLVIDARFARQNARRDAAAVGNTRADIDAWVVQFQARQERDDAIAAGDEAEAFQLQVRLDQLEWDAAIARRDMPAPFDLRNMPGMPGNLLQGGGQTSTGTFNRFAAMGWTGAAGMDAEPLAIREARLAREAVQVAAERLAEIRAANVLAAERLAEMARLANEAAIIDAIGFQLRAERDRADAVQRAEIRAANVLAAERLAEVIRQNDINIELMRRLEGVVLA